MPARKRFKTRFPGVFHIEGKTFGTGKKERIYYIVYRKDGRQIEERVGRQFRDKMTPAKARRIRNGCIEGKRLCRKEIRDRENMKKKIEGNKEERGSDDLKLLEEKWPLFANAATDGFWLFDSELSLVELNEAALASLPPGSTREDMIGRNVIEFFPEGRESGEVENFREVVKTGKPFVVKDITLVKELIVPYLEKLKMVGEKPEIESIVNIIETNLGDIISPFAQGLSKKLLKLSSTLEPISRPKYNTSINQVYNR